MLALGLLYAAVAGLICSTGFLVLVLYAVVRFRATHQRVIPNFFPPVTLLKTLYGNEPRLEENLESFFRQDYPAFEIIFGARDDSDPALRVVEKLRRKYPQVEVKIAFSGEPGHPNAKVCSLKKMIAAASTDFYVISDSDVHVETNYIREIMAPFADPRIGMVTCLYRGVPTGGPWSLLEALGMSVEMTSGVVVADALEGMKFALGPTMIARRQALEQIGGIGILADYCSDDYMLGNLIAEAGWTVVISHHIINHVVLNQDFKTSILHQVRWMKSTRFSRPKGHLGTALTFAMPFGVLGLFAALTAGKPALGLALLAWAVLNRIILSLASGWGVVRDPNAIRYAWLYPLRDLMGFFFWVASYGSSVIVWRDQRYQITENGKMVFVSWVKKEPAQPVAVDILSS